MAALKSPLQRSLPWVVSILPSPVGTLTRPRFLPRRALLSHITFLSHREERERPPRRLLAAARPCLLAPPTTLPSTTGLLFTLARLLTRAHPPQAAFALVGGYALYEKAQQTELANAPLKAQEFNPEEAQQWNKGVKAELLPVPKPVKR